MVKLLVKIADMTINRHNNILRETCVIFVFDLAQNRARVNAFFGWAGWIKCHVNAKEMKVIPLSCKQPLNLL